MPSAARLFYWEGVIVIGGLFGVIARRLFTGGISLDFLLYGDRRDRTTLSGFSTVFSPGRTQLLIVTSLTAGYYLLQVIHDPTTFPKNSRCMGRSVRWQSCNLLGWETPIHAFWNPRSD